MKRRSLVLAGAAAAAGGLAVSRPADHGAGGHDSYFESLSGALRAAGIGRPTLIIDRARLLANIATVRNAIGHGHAIRVVAKSLPSFKLLDAVMQGVGTRRAMVFNGATLQEVGDTQPEADLLLGKPLPALEVSAFLQRRAGATHPAAQPQFLVDGQDRLRTLIDMARAYSTDIRVNFEIDVGLHRGGLADPAALAACLDLAASEPRIKPCGLMGYDPHVVKVPMRQRALAAAQHQYAACRDVLHSKLPQDPAHLTLNTAGSPTYRLHLDDRYANELALGSAFVKPGDFDIPTLADHVPAAFIAAPVIKAEAATRIPGLEFAAPLLRLWDRNTAQAFFIYGGHWLAKPVSPPGLDYNALFGRSSNQEMLNGSARVRLRPDDYVFLRPDQSEAVFLQFGDIAVYDNGHIVERWPTFPISA